MSVDDKGNNYRGLEIGRLEKPRIEGEIGELHNVNVKRKPVRSNHEAIYCRPHKKVQLYPMRKRR